MIFSDPFFLFLVLPITVFLFYALRHLFGKTMGLAVIFAASIIVYFPWGTRDLTVLLVSLVVNFLCVYTLLTLDDARAPTRRTAVWIGQTYNLLTLVWFKYNFFRLLLAGLPISFGDAVIPIGISFYTFQQAAVLADAYAREQGLTRFIGEMRDGIGKLRGFIRYGFFVTFFPHMIIGPIAYVHEIEPQVSRARFGRVNQIDLAVGLMLVGIGLFKKLAIADNLAGYVDPTFVAVGQGHSIAQTSAWLAVFGYYAQLYFDFSGYSDMALGLARMFGITFPINFFSPLKSVGIVDFYRRWHMTLTRVISRFLFTTLSLWGARFAARRGVKGPAARMLQLWLPLLINFEVIGLWHGATSTFIVFGLIHGIWYVFETEIRATKRWRKYVKATSSKMRHILGRMIFTVPMALTFALFRSESIPAFGTLCRQLFVTDPFAPAPVGLMIGIAWVAGAMGIIHLLPNSVELLRRYRPGIMTYTNPFYGFRLLWRPNLVWSAYWVALVLCAMYFVWRQPPFLYMGF